MLAEIGETGRRHQMEAFPRYWPSVREIHRSPVNSLNKGQWRTALMFYLIWAWINGRENNRESWGFQSPSRLLWRHCNDRNDYNRLCMYTDDLIAENV